MADPIISPDGKWMWTGTEWISAPPTSAQGAHSNINLEDSMMSGDVNIEQGSTSASSAINLKDSAMSGDINLTQNSASDMIAGIEHLLTRMGYDQDASHSEDTSERQNQPLVRHDAHEGALNYIRSLQDFAHQRLIDIRRLAAIFDVEPMDDGLILNDVTAFEIPEVDSAVEYRASGNIDSGVILSLTSVLEKQFRKSPSVAYIDCLERFMNDCGGDLNLLRARFDLEPAYV